MNESMNESLGTPSPETSAESPRPAAPEQTNPFFTPAPVVPNIPIRTPMYVPALVLGIVSIVFSLLIALVGDICGVIGISLAVSRRHEYNVTAGLICSIVGLVISILNHILAIMMLSAM